MRFDPSQPIIVGIDGSPASMAALDWALRVLAPDGATRVIAVHCWERTSAEMEPHWVEEAMADDTARAHRWCEPWADRSNLQIVTTESDPRSALHQQLDQHGGGLVVVGDRGRGGVLGLGLGSVATHVLHQADVPVAVVPSHATVGDLGPFVVGVDGSDANRPALQWAVDATRAGDRTVVAVHAAENEENLKHGAIVENWAWPSADDARAELAELTGTERDRIEVVFRVGHPVPVLESVSSRCHAAAIVVGTMGAGGFAGMRIGRIAQQTCQVATRPVVVVPHA